MPGVVAEEPSSPSATQPSPHARKDDIRHSIATWIASACPLEDPGCRTQYLSHIEKWHPGTIEWLYSDEKFRKWYTAKKSTSLLLTALPGSGKTILASALTQRLRDEGKKVALFYYSFNRASKSAESALFSLAIDLLSLNETLPDDLLRLYHEQLASYRSASDNPATVIRIIEALIKTIKRVHIVIDGLDECLDRNKLFDRLQQLLKAKTLGVVQWFFTSRPEHKICETLRSYGVVHLDAPDAAIKRDVASFIDDRTGRADTLLAAKGSDDPEFFDTSFLWAAKVIEIAEQAQGKSSEEVTAEIEALPRTLSGLYARSFNRLAKLPSEKQRLAKKLIAFVVAAEQPLRLSELSHALATGPRIQDFSASRVPSMTLIGQLGTDFIVFDSTFDPDDPIVRVPHKTILEFISDNKQDADLAKSIRQFLTTSEAANRALGEACVRYLSHTRYATPSDLRAMLHHKDHAFLRYAVTYWHHHLDVKDPNPELQQFIQVFMGSPSFWTCVALQTYIAPFIFARYSSVSDDGLGFDGVTGNMEKMPPPDRVRFGSPLPWFLRTDKAGLFIEMIMQWHHILNTYPDQVEHCRMPASWELRWPQFWQWIRARRPVISVSTLPGDEDNLWTKCELEQSRRRLCCIMREVMDLKPTSNDQAIQKMSCRFCAQAVSAEDGTNIPVDESLATRAGEYDELVQLLTEKIRVQEGEWRLVSVSCDIELVGTPPTVLAAQWHAESFVQDTKQRPKDTSKDITDNQCLLIHRKGIGSEYHTWKSEYGSLVISCAFHPTESWVFWSPQPTQLWAARGGAIEKFSLPEPELDRSNVEVAYRELSFTKDGNQLWYVLFTCEKQDLGVKHVLSVAGFGADFADGVKLQQTSRHTIEYCSFGYLTSPGVMTAWTKNHLFVALPPLASKPKILRLALTDPSSFETLRAPIYFPATTQERQPRFSAFIRGPQSDILTLSLGAETPTVLTEDKLMSVLDYAATSRGRCSVRASDSTVVQGAYHIAWKLESNDWRTWEDDDGQSDEYRFASAPFENLRGSYIAKNKPFRVTTRCGLDWTRQAFLSCY